MKTRYLTVLFIAAGAAGVALGACSTDTSNIDPNVEARLRNNPPGVCTADQIAACPALNVTRCADGLRG